ncbi:MAG: hypothetical protein KGI89_15085, partial [Euryarchaeota archaeon]|nr:hypothetical protein [Euryarchaeota archaeon]
MAVPGLPSGAASTTPALPHPATAHTNTLQTLPTLPPGFLGRLGGVAHFLPSTLLFPSGESARSSAASPNIVSYCGAFGCGPLTYYGGPVMHNPTVYQIWWEPSGFTYDGTDTLSVGASDQEYRNVINGWFLNDTNSGWMTLLQQYTDGSGAPGKTVTLAGQFMDTSAFPCGTCGSVRTPLYDSDVQTEVQKIITNYGTPDGYNTEYFVYTPLGVVECQANPPGRQGCTANAGGTYAGYCAYHGGFTDANANPATYAYMYDVGSSLGSCSSWTDTVFPYGANGDQYADYEISVVSHEFAESITDVDVWQATTCSSGTTLAWYDCTYGEIGDECAYVFPGAGALQDHPVAVQLQHPYFYQPEYSNSAGSCAFDPASLPAASGPSIVNVNA